MNTKMVRFALGLALSMPLTAGLRLAAAQKITVGTPPAAVFLQPATPVAGVPGEFTFTGTIINVSTTPLFLNGDEFSPVAPTISVVPGMTFDDSPFFNNAPTSLDALGGIASSYSGTLFTMTVAPNTLPGTYSYTYNILGGTSGITNNVIASTAPFTITVAAPEPSVLAPFGLGAFLLIVLAGASRLRARRTA